MALYKTTTEIVIKLTVQHVCNDGNNKHLIWLLLDLENKLYQLIVLLPCSKTFQTQDRIAVTNQSSWFTVNDYDLCWVCTPQSASTCCHDFFCCDSCAGLYCTQVSDKPHFLRSNFLSPTFLTALFKLEENQNDLSWSVFKLVTNCQYLFWLNVFVSFSVHFTAVLPFCYVISP